MERSAKNSWMTDLKKIYNCRQTIYFIENKMLPLQENMDDRFDQSDETLSSNVRRNGQDFAGVLQ